MLAFCTLKESDTGIFRTINPNLVRELRDAGGGKTVIVFDTHHHIKVNAEVKHIAQMLASTVEK